MTKASIVVSSHYRNNRIFDLSNKLLNRDDCLRPFYLLKNEMESFGYSLATDDIHSPGDSEIVIYNEMPKNTSGIVKEKSYLLIFESELIRPDNWDKKKHELFKKIFTWNDDFVDNKKYFKFNFGNTFKYTEPNLDRLKLACLISGNKTSSHSKELYSERLKTINWFEANHKDHFDYFGIGWDKYNFGSELVGKILNKLGAYKILPKRQTPCYRGLVDKKHETLQNYKFNICYENAKDITGYITEKIFDALFAGCIPIYWGPQNIKDYVDQDCYIDRAQFSSNKELFDHISTINNDELFKIQENILRYLKSDKAKQFSESHFAENIADTILTK